MRVNFSGKQFKDFWASNLCWHKDNCVYFELTQADGVKVRKDRADGNDLLISDEQGFISVIGEFREGSGRGVSMSTLFRPWIKSQGVEYNDQLEFRKQHLEVFLSICTGLDDLSRRTGLCVADLNELMSKENKQFDDKTARQIEVGLGFPPGYMDFDPDVSRKSATAFGEAFVIDQYEFELINLLRSKGVKNKWQLVRAIELIVKSQEDLS